MAKYAVAVLLMVLHFANGQDELSEDGTRGARGQEAIDRHLSHKSMMMTHAPSYSPTTYPPTYSPTPKPTQKPTPKPTPKPTQKPTETPTEYPTESPTPWPTDSPTFQCQGTLDAIRDELEILPRGTIGSGDVVNSYNPINENGCDVFIFSGDICYVVFCEEGTPCHGSQGYYHKYGYYYRNLEEQEFVDDTSVFKNDNDPEQHFKDKSDESHRRLQEDDIKKDQTERKEKWEDKYYYDEYTGEYYLKPTPKPTQKPTKKPTQKPTREPTDYPTYTPTETPTGAPTITPPLKIELKKGTVIALVQDMDCGPESGPVISGDLFFDCQGHTVVGYGYNGLTSIGGANIQHCEVQGFNRCISLEREGGSPVVEDTLVTGCKNGIVQDKDDYYDYYGYRGRERQLELSDGHNDNQRKLDYSQYHPTFLKNVFAIDNHLDGIKIAGRLKNMHLVTCANDQFDFRLMDIAHTTGDVVCDTGLACIHDYKHLYHDVPYDVTYCKKAGFCFTPKDYAW